MIANGHDCGQCAFLSDEVIHHIGLPTIGIITLLQREVEPVDHQDDCHAHLQIGKVFACAARWAKRERNESGRVVDVSFLAAEDFRLHVFAHSLGKPALGEESVWKGAEAARIPL